MDLFKFESLLKQSCLFFCRADKLSDPFEASLRREEAERIKHAELLAELIGEDLPLLPGQNLWEPARYVRARSIRSFVVNCWHINAINNDKFWNPNEIGLFIPCDIDLLVERVILSPTSDEIAHKRVIELVEQHGAKLTIETSELNQKPSY
jgi:hypothetical protein